MTVSRARDTGLALTLALTGAPASLGVVCLSPVLPLIEAAHVGQPDVLPLVKYVSVGLGLGMVIGAPLAGTLSDRVGRRITLIAATIGFCLLGAAGYFVDDILLLIVMRTLAGACAAAILTMGVALMGECCAPEQRDRLIGLNAMASSLAAIATVAIAGVLGSVSVKLPFLLHLVPLPLFGLALAYVPTKALAQGKSRHSPAEPLITRHWPILAIALASGVAIFSIPVYLPFFMRDAGFGDPRLTAGVLATMSMCAASYAALYGWARSRLSLSAAFMTCLGLLGAGCVILLVSIQLPAFWFAAVLLGCGSAWVAPSLMSAANLLPAAGNRGRVVGLVKGANLSGSFLAVAVLDPLYRAMGTHYTLFAIAFLAVALIALVPIGLRGVGSP